jgi:hypothetical protein
MRFLECLLAVAVLLAAAADAKKCHNITGTCFGSGFLCASGEVVPAEQRCNGFEDCTDGTDEFLCEHDNDMPMHLRTPEERHAFHQQGCARCDCVSAVSVIGDFNGWYEYAKTAPTDPIGLMTGSGPYAGLPCNPQCTKQYLMAFYKKSGVCRGWMCCARQRECQICHPGSFIPGCTGRSPGNRCYA